MATYNVKDYGAKGDGATDDTVAINFCLTACGNAGGGTVYIPSGTYMIISTRIQIQSNTTVIMTDTTILSQIACARADMYGIVDVNQVSNVSIIGGMVSGDRYTHTGSTGEFGHGILIRGSTNITVTNTIFNKCWGDGIFIDGSYHNSVETYNDGIYLTDITSTDNRRQGISIISGQNMIITRPVLTYINGTDPMAGIDFEPDINTNILKNIKVIDAYTAYNTGCGMSILLTNLPGTTQPVDIQFINHRDVGSTKAHIFALHKTTITPEVDVKIIYTEDFNVNYRAIDPSFKQLAPTVNVLRPKDSGARLSWTPVVGALYYKIWMSTVSGSYGTEIATLMNQITSYDLKGLTNYDASGLTNGTKYYFAVTSAVSTGGLTDGDGVTFNEIGVIPHILTDAEYNAANTGVAIDAELNSRTTALAALTAQAAVLAPGTLLKRFSTTLASAVTAVTISTGDDGNALSGKIGSLRILVPAGCSVATGTNSVIKAQINGITTAVYRDEYASTTLTTNIFIGNIKNQYGSIWCDMNVLANNSLIIKGHYSNSDNTTPEKNTVSGAITALGSTKISSIYFYSTGAYTFPVGTIIEYWEAPA